MAQEPITICVKFDVHRLSKNMRIHWAERASRVNAAKMAARVAWHIVGSPVVDGPVEVQLTVRRGRPIDPDNALGGFSAAADSLFKSKHNGYGVTPDDSAKYISWLPVQFECGRQWKGNEHVLVQITHLETSR